MTIIPGRNWKQRLWKIWGGGVNKVHYGLCENGEFWEILLVESGTLRKSLQFERKKLLQKAVGFEPTTQMVQYCRFSHDVTIIQNKNNSPPQTRPEKAHFIQMREKINGQPLWKRSIMGTDEHLIENGSTFLSEYSLKSQLCWTKLELNQSDTRQKRYDNLELDFSVVT